jgi:hypothetical protein
MTALSTVAAWIHSTELSNSLTVAYNHTLPSSDQYPIASARCSGLISSERSLSAIVRATRRPYDLWLQRADLAELTKELGAAFQGWRTLTPMWVAVSGGWETATSRSFM